MYHYEYDKINNKEAKYYFGVLNVVVEVLKLLIYISIHIASYLS